MDSIHNALITAGLPSPRETGGLSAREAEARLKADRPYENIGETRSVSKIIYDNCITLFNFVNLGLAALIILYGDLRNAVFLGVALASTLIGIAQELRAKRTLDRFNILHGATVDAVRDGAIVRIGSTRVVKGDILKLSSGGQVVADCVCVHSPGLSVSEALITGEADDVLKQPGDKIWSGSFVTSGEAYVQAIAVGRDCFAARLSAEAKREKSKKSQLIKALGSIIKVLAISIMPVGALLFAAQSREAIALNSAITGTAAALVGMIPQGLILLTNVAFAVGVANLGMRQAVVRSLPCIEALARVDVLCLDKTGTITDGNITVKRLIPLNGESEASAAACINRLLHALPAAGPTAAALRNEFLRAIQPEQRVKPLCVTPFSSARKYGSAVFPGETLMLGAPSHVPLGKEVRDIAGSLAREGGRIIALARGEESGDSIQGVALIEFEDNIRPEARDTFARFQAQGVTLKLISGDAAATASNAACRVGILNAENNLDLTGYADEINAGQPAEVEITPSILNKTVFGRVTPYQKRSLIRLMRSAGHIVAMTGDGVNDVLALKEADCGIAMANGSEASRAVADLVLLTSDFSVMTAAVNEGRRVINNIEKMASLYLNKTIYSAILALAVMLTGGAYPFAPIQLTLISALTIGIPSFFLTLEPNYRPIKGGFIKTVLTDAAPAAISTAAHVILIVNAAGAFMFDQKEISTACAFVTGALGFFLMARAARPYDRRRAFMCACLGAAFICAFLLAPRVFMFAEFNGALALAACALSATGMAVAYMLQKLIVFINKTRHASMTHS
jgi:cation-transporting ATPase E